MGAGLQRAVAAALATQGKRSKYKNKPVEIDGIRFPSQAEGRRYVELKLLERAGEIVALKLQPRFPLFVDGKKICEYRGDFYFREARCKDWDKPVWCEVVEDVKGFSTDAFKIKRKLFEALHPLIELRIVKA